METYNGSNAQIEPFWANNTSFPLLTQGGRTANKYGLSVESVAVIDHENRLTYRVVGFLPTDRIREKVAEAVANVPPPESELDSAVEPITWGGLKANPQR